MSEISGISEINGFRWLNEISGPNEISGFNEVNEVGGVRLIGLARPFRTPIS